MQIIIDRQTSQVELSHASARNTATNRKAVIKIVRREIFAAASNPYIHNVYDNYICHLYSNQKGGVESVSSNNDDYPF